MVLKILILGLLITLIFAKEKFVQSDEVLIDNINGLVWQDNIYPSTKHIRTEIITADKTSEAMDYCKNLELNGIKTWRLPSFEEISNVNFLKFKHHIKEGCYLTQDFTFLSTDNYNEYKKSHYSPFVTATQYCIYDLFQGRVVQYEDFGLKGYVKCVADQNGIK